MDGWMVSWILTAIVFTPSGSVKVQYIQSNTKQNMHNSKKNTTINNNEQYNNTEEYSNTKNCTLT